MVGVHAGEQAAQEVHGLDDVRPLVEHHALGPAAHDGVADLGARRGAALGQTLQHLCGPDHRHVRGLAQPQDLLLDLGQAFEAELHGEVAAGDHHAHGRGAQAGEQDARQVHEGRTVLDLEHDAQVAGAEAMQPLLEQQHVLRAAQEGERDHVGELHHLGQVLEVLLGERGEVERRVGQIDALFRTQLGPRGRGMGDLHADALAVVVEHASADLAVVQPHALAGTHAREGRLQGAVHVRRAKHRYVK